MSGLLSFLAAHFIAAIAAVGIAGIVLAVTPRERA